MLDPEDQIESEEQDAHEHQGVAPPLMRMDTVQSLGGWHYDVLPLPSPACEEVDGNVTFTELDFKPVVPYTAVYSSPSHFVAGISSVFLLKTKVNCKVTDMKRDTTFRHPLNPYLYTVEISHGRFVWTIRKRFKHFMELHEKLWAYRTSLKLPLPSKKHKQKRKSRHGLTKKEAKIPFFPKKPEVLISGDELEKRKNQLERYLNAVLESRLYRNQTITKRFLEVSRLSFVQELGLKGKEGIIKKRSGGRKVRHIEIFTRWDKRWFVVKDSFLAYLDPSQTKLRAVLLFDSQIDIQHQSPPRKLAISNSSRRLKVNCWTERQAVEWKRLIESSIQDHSAGLSDKNIRLESFAPQRKDSLAHWFVDGRSYFDALADAMEEAKEEIFITDWWLSPEIYLKRPITRGDYWRLDQILKRKAEEGVKIYVQLYKEVEVAVNLNSEYTKQTLLKLHPTNIRVMRHPDISPGESLLWAHHEKIVVIDQIVAFIGGIDLCYGRWDDQDHLLTDVASGGATIEDCTEVDGPTDMGTGDDATMKPTTTGMVFGMFGIMTVGVVSQFSKDKMPDKDMLAAPPENSGQKETNRLKRFLTKRRKERPASADFEPQSRDKASFPRNGVTSCDEVDGTTLLVGEENDSTNNPKESEQVSSPKTVSFQPSSEPPIHAEGPESPKYLQKYRALVHQVERASQPRLWIGKDYSNFILKDLTNLDNPFEDEIDRHKVARMPWHDIACVTYGKAARDTARHFIQRWNFTKNQKAKETGHITYLLPKTYSEEFTTAPSNMILPEAVQADVQILRSSCKWSAGISVCDHSIQNAYLYAIEKSQHFIYIENQFFISRRDDNKVKNSIVEALYQRILRANNEQKNFKVYVVMPLIPGFEGDISDQTKSQAIRTVLHWQYKSICRGTGSLMEDLNHAIGPHNTNRYISFCGLRTHSKLNGKPISEMIYVHSKMLIVDDRITIIGSANINDRSMTGKRDSEVAMLVEDTQFVNATFDGEEVQVGKYGAALRRRCFCEHLGLLPENYDGTHSTFDPLTHQLATEVEDVVSDHFFKTIWTKIAAVNTTVYEKVFRCVPSDYVRKLSDIQKFEKDPLCEVDVEAAEKELEKVKGQLVLLPLHFLIDEDLSPDALSKEGLAPTDLWT